LSFLEQHILEKAMNDHAQAEAKVSGAFDLKEGEFVSGRSGEVNVVDTSRSKSFEYSPNAIHYVSKSIPGLIYLSLFDFKVILTEETLSVGNISTHIKLQFDVASRWHRGTGEVAIKAYRDANNFLYDIQLPDLDIHCRPQDRYSYDSGLVKLAHNHFDII
jgi:hypothetical protein